MKLTPDAGSIKSRKARIVPLHEDLLAQGFLQFVKARGKGPLFYNPQDESADTGDPLNPKRPRAVKTRERLAAWVRTLGVKDREISPNHSWRHTFKQIAERHGISERVSDAITGHAPATVGRSYGAPTVDDMARELAKFPRYKI
jgi:integrase